MSAVLGSREAGVVLRGRAETGGRTASPPFELPTWPRQGDLRSRIATPSGTLRARFLGRGCPDVWGGAGP